MTRPTLIQAIIGVLLMAAISFVALSPGCAVDSLKANIAQATGAVTKIDSEVERLTADKLGLTAALEAAEAELATSKVQHEEEQARLRLEVEQAQSEAERQRLQELIDERAAMMTTAEEGMANLQNTLTDITNRIGEKLANKDKYVTAIQGWNEQVQASASTEDVIRATGVAAAPFAGPYAPLVLIGTNLLAAILGGAYNGKRTAEHIVRPIEAARAPLLEAKLNAEAGEFGTEYIVFDKQATGTAHNSNGAGKAIAAATIK